MNFDKVNVRLVVLVLLYKEIIKGYLVNFFFYVNNYEGVEEGGKYLNYFIMFEEVIKVFKVGVRMVKGMIIEKGFVEFFFVNLFGLV